MEPNSSSSREYSSDRRMFLKVASGVAAAGIAVLAGCADGNGGGGEQDQGPTETATETPTPTSTPTSTSTKTAGKTESGNGGGTSEETTVQMVTEGSNYYFDPVGLYVNSGDTVTFTIQSGSHSSTAYKKGNSLARVTRIPTKAKGWNSGTISQGSFKHTFKVKGTYDYFCIPHKSLGMVGRIVVEKPGGPAEGSMPPDGTVPKSQRIVEKGSVPWSEKYGQ